MLTRVPRPSISAAERIASQLQSDILSGVLRPGEIISQSAIAKRFGVSRIPVREALRSLAADGHVFERRNQRPVIAELDPHQVTEYLDVREAIELRVMRLALESITPEQIQKARCALAAIDRADHTTLLGRHHEFHATLYTAARRPYMVELIKRHRFIDARDVEENTRRRLRNFLDLTSQMHVELITACERRHWPSVRRCIVAEITLLRSLHSPVESQ